MFVLWATVTDDMSWGWAALGLLSVPALVLLNGLFVAAEFSLVAVRRTRIEEMVNRNLKGAKALESAVNHLDRSIAATQLGITLASIGLGWTGEPALARLLTPCFLYFSEVWGPVAAHSLSTGIAFALITFMHVVFGELIPKSIALQQTDRTALWVVAPLNVFSRVSRPVIKLMNGTGNTMLRWLGFEASTGEEAVHSLAELALLVEDSEEAGLIDPDQAEFVQNVFRLSDKRVRDCLVPRERVAGLELNSPSDKIMEAVRSGAHTRMPVYEGDPDNIVGIVNTKNLFYLFSLKGVVVLEDALYPALFLKPDETMANALRLFRKAHRPMALVRDEQGKIHGLITLEDIIEEIVGDIEDEHDRPTPKIRPRRLRPMTIVKPTPPNRK